MSTGNMVPALVCHALKPELAGVSYSQIELPAPTEQQVQIGVRAAALNFPDLLMTEGLYQHKPELPFVPGMEGAGDIIACGNAVTGLSVGDKVRFSCRSGACAAAVNVPVQSVWAMPASFSYAQAGAFHVGALTAYVALVRRGRLAAGETLLVHGATGGMGLAAVQLGAHLGATVIGTGTDPDKLAIAAKLGATHTIQIGPGKGFRDSVKSLTAGAGADVVFDPVGGDVFDESLRVMAWGGRLLVIGFASGRIPVLPANLALIKGFSLVGVRAGEFGRRQPRLGIENEQALNTLAEAGVMTPHIGATYSLANGLRAMQALRSRDAAGKIVIEMTAPSDVVK